MCLAGIDDGFELGVGEKAVRDDGGTLLVLGTLESNSLLRRLKL